MSLTPMNESSNSDRSIENPHVSQTAALLGALHIQRVDLESKIEDLQDKKNLQNKRLAAVLKKIDSRKASSTNAAEPCELMLEEKLALVADKHSEDNDSRHFSETDSTASNAPVGERKWIKKRTYEARTCKKSIEQIETEETAARQQLDAIERHINGLEAMTRESTESICSVRTPAKEESQQHASSKSCLAAGHTEEDLSSDSGFGELAVSIEGPPMTHQEFKTHVYSHEMIHYSPWHNPTLADLLIKTNPLIIYSARPAWRQLSKTDGRFRMRVPETSHQVAPPPIFFHQIWFPLPCTHIPCAYAQQEPEIVVKLQHSKEAGARKLDPAPAACVRKECKSANREERSHSLPEYDPDHDVKSRFRQVKRCAHRWRLRRSYSLDALDEVEKLAKR